MYKGPTGLDFSKKVTYLTSQQHPSTFPRRNCVLAMMRQLLSTGLYPYHEDISSLVLAMTIEIYSAIKTTKWVMHYLELHNSDQ